MTTAASYEKLTKLESARLPLCMLACKGVPDVSRPHLSLSKRLFLADMLRISVHSHIADIIDRLTTKSLLF